MAFSISDEQLRVGRVRVRKDQRIRIRRTADTLVGTFGGIIPAQENGKSARARKPRVILCESKSVIEYVAKDDICEVEILEVTK